MFKVDERVRITKYKNVFSKVFTVNWSREIFIIDSVHVKNNILGFKDLKGEKILGPFYKKGLSSKSSKFRVNFVIE